MPASSQASRSAAIRIGLKAFAVHAEMWALAANLSIDGMSGGYQRMGEFYRSGCFLAGGDPASVGSVIPDTSEVCSHVSLRDWQSIAE